MNFELIVTTDSKLIETNLPEIKKLADKYIASLTTDFKTDNDFAKAESETKELKTYEDNIRTGVKSVLDGSSDISDFVKTAEEIAERLRQERLRLEKLVKAEKENRKREIINEASSQLKENYGKQSAVVRALEIKLPFSEVQKQLTEATKGKKGIEGIQKEINAKHNELHQLIKATAGELITRASLIPADKKHLFTDEVQLIASDQDIAQIVQQRLKAEEERIEAQKKAEAERAEAKRIADQEKAQLEAQKAVETPQEQNNEQAEIKTTPTKKSTETTPPISSSEEKGTFAVIITMSVTQSEAIAHAKALRDKYGNVELKKI